MCIHITLIGPGEKYGYSKGDILIELSPTGCCSIEEDRQFWKEAGESPDIVAGHLILSVSEEIGNYIEELRERDGPEMIETILTAAFNLGRAYQE